MADLAAVMAEHHANVGFREGPNNTNPWGPEQGVGNHQPYCDSGASMVPFHHGMNWWSDCTFGAKGCAYTVAHVAVARNHGKYVDDHASRGAPAPLAVGQLVFFDYNHSGSVDHVETVSAIPQGPYGTQYETIGYNTGPRTDGCYRQLRDRTYLHGTVLMDWAYPPTPQPQPPTPPPTPPVTQEDEVIKLIHCDPNRNDWPEIKQHVFKTNGLKEGTEYLVNMNHAAALQAAGVIADVTIHEVSPRLISELISDADLQRLGLTRPAGWTS